MKTLKPEHDVKSEFEEQLLQNMNSLFNLAYRLTSNREDARDLVQEASLRAFRFYHKFERGTNFKAWALTILRNLFINQYRKKMKQPLTLKFEDFEYAEVFASVPAATGFEEEIFSEHVQKSIDKLPEELRTALILFYGEELSYKEIAKVMNCPIGTVMSRLHMAKQVLKRRLSEITRKEGQGSEVPGN